MNANRLREFLETGGPALWVIAALSVMTLALILWKVWRLSLAGAWAGKATEQAVTLWCAGDADAALSLLAPRRSLRARLALAAMQAQQSNLSPADAREETTRVAKSLLSGTRGGLRALELIATIAPLVGLLGTVLGMIEAFQALQAASKGRRVGAAACGL